MTTSIIVRDTVGYVPYWAADETLSQVRTRFKRLAGRFPSSKASIIAFTGPSEDIDQIEINDLGDISYPKTVTKIIIQPYE